MQLQHRNGSVRKTGGASLIKCQDVLEKSIFFLRSGVCIDKSTSYWLFQLPHEKLSYLLDNQSMMLCPVCRTGSLVILPADHPRRADTAFILVLTAVSFEITFCPLQNR